MDSIGHLEFERSACQKGGKLYVRIPSADVALIVSGKERINTEIFREIGLTKFSSKNER